MNGGTQPAPGPGGMLVGTTPVSSQGPISASSRRTPRRRCPWCQYDVTRLPSGNVCPECGGRLTDSDYLRAAERETAAWRGVALLELLAPAVGLWIGVVVGGLFAFVHDSLLPVFPFATWLLTSAVLGLPRLTPGRTSAPSVRRRHSRAFAVAIAVSMLIAVGLAWGVSMLPVLSAGPAGWSGPIITNGSIPIGHILLVLFGIGTGALAAIPVARLRRIRFDDPRR